MKTNESHKITPNPTHRGMVLRAFWCGWLFHLLFDLFFQDWHGKAGYMELVDRNWLDIHWATWVPPIIICGYYYWSLLNMASDRDSYGM